MIYRRMRRLMCYVTTLGAFIIGISIIVLIFTTEEAILTAGDGRRHYRKQQKLEPISYPHLTADVGSNLTSYLKIKFGKSCYQEAAFPIWWYNYTLNSKYRLTNKKGCRRIISDVFIVGVKKCATDALRDLLVIHPYIMFSRIHHYENHFYDRYYHKGYEWYEKQFNYAKDGQLVLEKSPQTFSFPEEAPKRMTKEVNPKTKIIVILCDPVVRAVSDYVHESIGKFYTKHLPHYRINDKSFELSVFNDSGIIDVDNELIRMGLYSQHMKRWLEYFPASQIHVVDAQDFNIDPISEIRKIERFLRLPPFVQKDHLDFSSPKFFCIAFPKRRCPKWEEKGREHPQIPQAVLDRLYKFYRPYDSKLQQLLNRTFSWMEKAQGI